VSSRDSRVVGGHSSFRCHIRAVSLKTEREQIYSACCCREEADRNWHR